MKRRDGNRVPVVGPRILIALLGLLLAAPAVAAPIQPPPAAGYSGRTFINIDGINVADASKNGGSAYAADCAEVQTAFTTTAGSAAVTVSTNVFAAADRNKGIEIEVYGPFKTISIFVGTISSVTSATQITLSGNFPNSLVSRVGRVRYGTDNTAAIVAAGNAAIALGNRFLAFRDGMSCAFGMGTTTDAAAVGNLIWTGNNAATGYFTDASGNQLTKVIVPMAAPTIPAPRQTIYGSSTLPRTASVAKPCVVAWGDSMAADPPSAGFSQTESPIYYFTRALQKANTNRSFTYLNRAIGGAIFPWFLSVPPGPLWPVWYTTQATAWATYVQQACGASTSPDLVALFENGGNDAAAIWPAGIAGTVNTIQGWSTVNGFPPDIVMNNGRNASLVATGSFSSYGTPTAQYSRENSSMLLRSMAQMMGLGFLDYESQALSVRNGWDSTNLGLVRALAATETDLTVTAPFATGYKVRDYDFFGFMKTGANNTAIWANWSHLLAQLGSRVDNIIDMSVDGSGNIQFQVNTWGNRSVLTPNPAAASVTVTAAALSVAAASTLTTTVTAGSAGNIITLGSVAGLAAGNAILIPTGQYPGLDGGVFRSWIVGISGNNVTLADYLPNVPSGSQTLSFGPLLFVASDAKAKDDIQIPGAGVAGGLYVGKVCAYSTAVSVTLCSAVGTNLTSSSQSVFLGRISVPLQSSTILANNGTCLNPSVEISIRDTILTSAYDACPNTTLTPTVTTSLGSPTLVNTGSAFFTADMLGRSITVAGVGASGGTYTGVISAVNSTTQAAVAPNIQTAVTSVAESTTIGPVASVLYRGPIERNGGPFVPFIATTAAGTVHFTPNPNSWFIDVPEPVMPTATDLEMWGTTFGSPPCTYAACGNGINHPTTTQLTQVDEVVMRTQNFGLPLPAAIPQGGTVTRAPITANDTTATAVSVPVSAKLRAVYIQNTTANAVTGNINIGTTVGGTDVASGVVVAGNAIIPLGFSPPKWFSASATQQLFITSPTWNSASLTVRFDYGQ